MKKLQDLDKSNTVYNLSKVILESRPDGIDSLMPLRWMPFGMIQFIVDFFASTNVMQVTIVRFFLNVNEMKFQECSVDDIKTLSNVY